MLEKSKLIFSQQLIRTSLIRAVLILVSAEATPVVLQSYKRPSWLGSCPIPAFCMRSSRAEEIEDN